MTDEEIKADRAVVAEAIDGPWIVKVREGQPRTIERTVIDVNGHWVAEVGDDKGSAYFIASARTRWPAALDEVERLRRALARVEVERTGAIGQRDLLSQKCYEHTQEILRLQAERDAMRAVVEAAVDHRDHHAMHVGAPPPEDAPPCRCKRCALDRAVDAYHAVPPEGR